MSIIVTNLFSKFTNSLKCRYQEIACKLAIARLYTTESENELSQYIIVKATKDDYVPVIDVMHNAFYADEPTCSCLGIGPNPVMDERAVKDMTEGMTLLTKLKNDGEIVGACVNCSLYPWDPDLTERLAKSCKCNKLKSLLLFYAHLTRRPDLWKSHEVKRIFEMAYIFVKPEHRQRGISFRMMQESKQLASERGFQVMRCDATNGITSRLCEKLGMKLVEEVPFSSYLGQDLQPVFQPPPPNESVKIYVDNSIESPKEPVEPPK